RRRNVSTAAIPGDGSRLQALRRQGHLDVVCAPRGTGAVVSRPINAAGAREAHAAEHRVVHATEHRLGCDAMMAGISTLGLRVLDVLRAYDYLAARPDTCGAPISIHGVGAARSEEHTSELQSP